MLHLRLQFRDFKDKILLDLSLADDKFLKAGETSAKTLKNKKILQSDKIKLENLLKKTTLIKINNELFPKKWGHGNLLFRAIYILTKVFENIGVLENEETTLYIDEPEKHLHPQYIKEMAIMLKQFSESTNIKLEIATHSPLIVNYLWDKSKTNLYTKNSFRDAEFTKIDIAEDTFAKNTINHREELIKSLFSDLTILVEGNNDFKFIEQYFFDNDIFNANIIRTSGKSYIKDLFNKLINEVKISEENIFIIYDVDSNSGNHKKWNDEINALTKQLLAVDPKIEKIFKLKLEKDNFSNDEIQKIIAHKDFNAWIKPLDDFLAKHINDQE